MERGTKERRWPGRECGNLLPTFSILLLPLQSGAAVCEVRFNNMSNVPLGDQFLGTSNYIEGSIQCAQPSLLDTFSISQVRYAHLLFESVEFHISHRGIPRTPNLPLNNDPKNRWFDLISCSG